MSMETKQVALSKIKPNKANPRVIKDSKFHKLVNSILVFPKMMEARPIVVNGEMVVLGGNMRLKALEAIKTMDESELRSRLGNCTDFTLKPEAERKDLVAWWIAWQDKPQTFVVNAKDFSDAEQKQFIVKDNASFGEWDFDALSSDFDVESLKDWGVDMPMLETEMNMDGFFSGTAADEDKDTLDAEESVKESQYITLTVPQSLMDRIDEIRAAVAEVLKNKGFGDVTIGSTV